MPPACASFTKSSWRLTQPASRGTGFVAVLIAATVAFVPGVTAAAFVLSCAVDGIAARARANPRTKPLRPEENFMVLR